MATIRRAADRFRTRLDWLDSRHTFSFGEHRDPRWDGFRELRVINDDRVAPGGGFATHPHRDMEILTWVLEGSIAHRDSLDNVQAMMAGELQRMSAGTGVTHSEYNPSDTEPLRFLQVWIAPERTGLEPSYEQRRFDRDERKGRWQLLAARGGEGGAVTVHQDVTVRAAVLSGDDVVRHEVPAGRHAWLQVATGTARAAGEALEEGAGLGVEGPTEISVSTEGGETEVLLFDLA